MVDFLREKYPDMLGLFCDYLEKNEFGVPDIAKRLTDYAEQGHNALEKQMEPEAFMLAADFMNDSEFIHQAAGFIMGAAVGARLMAQAMPCGMEMTATALKALVNVFADKKTGINVSTR